MAVRAGAGREVEEVASASFGSDVRDVPYVFPAAQRNVVLPRYRVFAAQRERVWRAGWVGALNAGVLLAGCLLLVFGIYDLQRWQGGFQRIGAVRRQAEAALSEMAAGRAALAAGDLARGEAAFAEAGLQLKGLQAELGKTLTAAQRLLAAVDVTGTVRDGERLLAAGADLAEAGRSLSRAVEMLLGGAVLEDEGLALTDGIIASRAVLEQAAVRLARAAEELGSVDSPLLPAPVREQAAEAASAARRTGEALRGYLAQTEALLTLLGADRERQYLLVFQNSHELRPTGGFIGSVGLIDVDRGRIENIDIASVYDPDGQLREFIAPPNPLSIVTDRWYLRDVNWFVDFPTSARKMVAYFEKEGGPTVDGVVALTPHVVQALLEEAGPITMPQYGVTISADNFWEVTQDQVSYFYDREKNKPKQFLADLTPQLLNRLLAEPQQRMGALGVLAQAAARKQLLLYFRDEPLQQRVAAAGWDGAFPRGDRTVLAVNTANVGGHKSDQFVTQQLDYDIQVRADGSADVTLQIGRTHHGPTEGAGLSLPPEENPAVKDNVVYQRVLVPAGSELVAARGFTPAGEVPRQVWPAFDVPMAADPDVAEWQRRQRVHPSGVMLGQEAGAASFAHWVVTAPGQTRTVLYQFRLPAAAELPRLLDPAGQWGVLLVKQPGDERTAVRVTVRLPRDVRVARTVPAGGVTVIDDGEFVYRGALQSDILLGAVLERN